MTVNIHGKLDFLDIHFNYESGDDRLMTITALEPTYNEFIATITGPVGTPYQKGQFTLHIAMPPNYPLGPPEIHFVTRVWHPNISPTTGLISLDVLKDKWYSELTLRTILILIQALLSVPKPDDSVDLQVGKQCRKKREMFDATAAVWTRYYANGVSNEQPYEKKFEYMINMGVPDDVALEILSRADWDLPESVKIAFQKLKNFEFECFF